MNREQLIKEARTIEAMKKGYMGMEGKFSTIAKQMGNAIIHHGNRSFEQSFLDDPFEFEDKNKIPIMDEQDNSYEVGLHFDGLSRGSNINIIVHFHHREIICEYEGRKVYKEVSGELEAYVPDPLWEDKIELFFDSAKKIEKIKKPQERKILIEEANKKRQELLNDFKLKWGLI